ncbi:MAG: hypothetical protein IID61_16440 [SAR324 cluster bacterium]|nr:hypothetical protein [SAR324 cluster bacterium]
MAAKHLRQANRIAEEREARPDLSINHFRYAECLHKKDDLDADREQPDQATALFGDMGMDRWSEQAGCGGGSRRGSPSGDLCRMWMRLLRFDTA